MRLPIPNPGFLPAGLRRRRPARDEVRSRDDDRYHDAKPDRSGRRRFLRAVLVGAGGASGLSALWALFVEPHWLEIVERDLPVVGLPAGLGGRTLALLTDLHVGPQVEDAYLIDTFRRVAALAPDLVAIGGDWMSYRGAGQVKQLARVLRHLPQGRLATLGILGNHDYGRGWRELAVAAAVERVARDAGVALLRNQAVDVAGLQVLGLDDFWSPRFGPAGLLRRHGGDPATIVLCHNPDVADQQVWGDYAGWVLCGHTHGGQCKPPFLPPPIIPVRNPRYTAGELALARGRRMYISRGVGHLLEARFNVRPEVTLFRLSRAA